MTNQWEKVMILNNTKCLTTFSVTFDGLVVHALRRSALWWHVAVLHQELVRFIERRVLFRKKRPADGGQDRDVRCRLQTTFRRFHRLLQLFHPLSLKRRLMGDDVHSCTLITVFQLGIFLRALRPARTVLPDYPAPCSNY